MEFPKSEIFTQFKVALTMLWSSFPLPSKEMEYPQGLGLRPFLLLSW